MLTGIKLEVDWRKMFLRAGSEDGLPRMIVLKIRQIIRHDYFIVLKDNGAYRG